MKQKGLKLFALFALSGFGSGVSQAAAIEYKIPATEAEFQTEWTIVSGTDGKTWTWVDGTTPYAQIPPCSSSQNNDITGTTLVYATPISMKKGDKYIFQANVCSADYDDEERFYLVIGTDKNNLEPFKITSDYVVKVWRAKGNSEPNFQIKPADSNAASYTTFIATEDGDYYIGIRSWYGSGSFADADKNLQVAGLIATKDVNYPANATGTKATAATDGSLSVTVEWKWPTTCKDGKTAITGELKANIYRGTSDSKADLYKPENKIATVTKADGQTTGSYVDNSITEPGKYYYYIAPENEFGENSEFGSSARCNCKWVGEDVKLLNVLESTVTATKSADGSAVILSWEERIKGYNEGYVNPEKVSYYIERSKNGGEFTLLAECYAGKPPYTDSNLDGFGSYQYRIYAVYNNDLDNKSTAAKSPVVVAGGSLDVPFTEDFSDKNNFSVFTVVSTNSSYKWTYASSGYTSFSGGSTYSPVTASLITPPLNLKAGKTYKVTAKSWVASSSKTMTVTAGPDPGALGDISSKYTISGTTSSKNEVEGYYIPETDGIYYFGFKCESSAYSAIYLDDISVEETAVTPLAVSDIAFTPDSKGANKTTVTFTNPSKSNGGQTLETLSSVVVSRIFDGEATVIKTLEGTEAKPGSAVSFIDEVPVAGKYAYSVISILDGNESYPATTSEAWVGYDIPAQVSSMGLNLESDENGGVTVKWTAASTTGKNSGYIDKNNLSYRVVRINSAKEQELVGETTDLQFYDSKLADAEWDRYTYGIITVNGYQTSDVRTPYTSVCGGKASLPYYPELTDDYVETFQGRSFVGDDGITFKNRGAQGSMEYIAYLPPFDVTNTSDSFWHALSLTLSRADAQYIETLEVLLCTVKLAEPSVKPEGLLDNSAAVIPGEGNREVLQTIKVEALKGVEEPQSKTVGFQIKDKGRYRIALRCASDYNKGLTIHNLSLVDSNTTGVESVTVADLRLEGNSLRLPDNAASASVYSIEGIMVASASGNGTIDMSSLAGGIYVVSVVTTDNETITVKINKH